MVTITYLGYVFKDRKWRYKMTSVDSQLSYEDAKQYVRDIFKGLYNNEKHFSLTGISVSK